MISDFYFCPCDLISSLCMWTLIYWYSSWIMSLLFNLSLYSFYYNSISFAFEWEILIKEYLCLSHFFPLGLGDTSDNPQGPFLFFRGWKWESLVNPNQFCSKSNWLFEKKRTPFPLHRSFINCIGHEPKVPSLLSIEFHSWKELHGFHLLTIVFKTMP